MSAPLPPPHEAAARLSSLPRGDGEVCLEREGALAVVRIDHPRRRNAMSVGMMLDFRAAVAALETVPAAAVVVHGAGGDAFCAGGDLRAVRRHLLDPFAAGAMASVMTDTLGRLAGLPALVYGAVDGPALGGGAEILTACDHVTASVGSIIGFVHARLGVSPGWGGGRRLIERIGARRAAVVLGEARRLTAREAHGAGLVDVVVRDGTALASVMVRARVTATTPLEAVSAAVRVATGREDEAATFLSLWGADAHLEALGMKP